MYLETEVVKEIRNLRAMNLDRATSKKSPFGGGTGEDPTE